MSSDYGLTHFWAGGSHSQNVEFGERFTWSKQHGLKVYHLLLLHKMSPKPSDLQQQMCFLVILDVGWPCLLVLECSAHLRSQLVAWVWLNGLGRTPSHVSVVAQSRLGAIRLGRFPRTAREGKSQCSGTFQVSACVTFATVPLAKRSRSDQAHIQGEKI